MSISKDKPERKASKDKYAKVGSKGEALAVEKQIGAVVAKHRAALNAEIKKINPDLIMELAVGPSLERAPDPSAFFSDWPDTWNDGGRWVKTWGKGGGDELLPLEELRERIIVARTAGLLKG